jgi:thioredoxin 1
MQKAMLIQVAAGLLIGGALGALLGYFGKCTTGTCPLTANPWRGGFLGAMIGGVLAFSAAGSRPSDEGSKSGYSAVHVANEAEFERLVLQAKQPVLVDFYSNGCGPCRMLAPTVERLAEDYESRAVVCKVNVDELTSLAQRYAISAIPAVLFFKDGREVQRVIGLRDRAAYTTVLDRL